MVVPGQKRSLENACSLNELGSVVQVGVCGGVWWELR